MIFKFFGVMNFIENLMKEWIFFRGNKFKSICNILEIMIMFLEIVLKVILGFFKDN